MSFEAWGEPDEPGKWFQELVEAPPDTVCHVCGNRAELQDDDGQNWCGPCAGEHDSELQYEY